MTIIQVGTQEEPARYKNVTIIDRGEFPLDSENGHKNTAKYVFSKGNVLRWAIQRICRLQRGAQLEAGAGRPVSGRTGGPPVSEKAAILKPYTHQNPIH